MSDVKTKDGGGEKTIATLVEDIYGLFNTDGAGFDPREEDVEAFGHALGKRIAERASEKKNGRALRLSAIGTKCLRKLWYTEHTPGDAEPLRPNVRIKFLFGDILEELLFFLARCAGHKVEGEQDEIFVEGVKGHRDAVVDGSLVDAKSASSFSFGKFLRGLTPIDDAFGYLHQLEAYLKGSENDEIVKDKDNAYFLAIDKQHGHIVLDKQKRKNYDLRGIINRQKEVLAKDVPPERGFAAEPDGKSGNMKLCTQCSYCDFKHKCWPGLRVFLYSNGPRYLTRVVRQPDVKEAKHDET